jgi:hypothetical protein
MLLEDVSVRFQGGPHHPVLEWSRPHQPLSTDIRNVESFADPCAVEARAVGNRECQPESESHTARPTASRVPIWH